jgi:outer membrane protein assembly factor BamB
MRKNAFFCLISTIATCAAQAITPAWPGFRGPNSSGVSTDAKPPIKISPTNSVLWKVQVPFSPSSPCVWGDQLFLTTFADNELQTHCYDCKDGKLAWSRGVKAEKLEMFHSTESSPAATTPGTDGQRVVSYFGSFGLVCYDLKGTELWRHPLPVALSLGGYGTASSPVIAGNLVVVSCDRDEQSALVAVDLSTGKAVWQSPRPDSYGCFGTPIIWQNNGLTEVIVPGSLRLKGYALKTGKEDWVVDGLTAYACTTPVAGDGLLFFAGWSEGKADAPMGSWEKFLEAHDKNKDGVVALDEFDDASRDFYRGYDVNRDGKIDKTDWEWFAAALAKSENLLVAVKPGGQGNVSQTHVAWKANRGLPYIASPLFYDGRIYLIKNGGMISSLDAKSGKPFYFQERLNAGGNYYSSPVAADGRLYIASVSGKLTVVQAGGDKPEILHQAEFGDRIFATPALAADKLFLRTQSTLYAFGAQPR